MKPSIDVRPVHPVLIPCIAFVLTCAVPLAYLVRFGKSAAFSFLVNDAYYYLSIANNSVGLPYYSFDGRYATNGFHPLWQYLLGFCVAHKIVPGTGVDQVISVVFFNVFLVAMSVFLACYVAARLASQKWLIFPLLLPGLSWLLVSPVAPDHLAVWSYANGMESPLNLLFFFAAVALISFRQRPSYVVASVFMMTLSVLARLDDVFILGALIAFVFGLWRTKRFSPRMLGVCIAIPVSLISCYLLYNVLSVGAAFPTSGASKAGFAAIDNFKQLVKIFLPIFSWDEPNFSASRVLKYSVYSEIFVREFQMLYPLVVCGAFLFMSRNEDCFPYSYKFLSFGIIVKSLYNFLFVSLFNQGYWYFPVSIIFSNLLVVLLVDRYLTRRAGPAMHGSARSSGASPTGSYMAAAIITLLSVNFFVNQKSNGQFGSHAREIYDHRQEILSEFAALHVKSFVEFDDGILGWATTVPTISGLGLALDSQSQAARKLGNFFEVAAQRGIDVGVAGGAYADYLRMWIAQNETSRSSLWGIRREEFDTHELKILRTMAVPDLLIFRIQRRGGSK